MKKGITNNPNGRPAGKPNLITRELRELLKAVIEKELEALADRLEKLPDEQRLALLVKLLPYILPRVESVNPKDGEPLSLNLDW